MVKEPRQKITHLVASERSEIGSVFIGTDTEFRVGITFYCTLIFEYDNHNPECSKALDLFTVAVKYCADNSLYQ